MRKFLLVAAAALWPATVAWLPTAGAATPAVPAASAVPDARVIVSYRRDAALMREHPLRAGVQAAEVRQVHQRRADSMGRRAGVALNVGRTVGVRAHVVTARGLSSQALAARLAADPNVEYAEVDRRRRAFLVPNDPLYLSGPAVRGPAVGQWHLKPPDDTLRSAANVQAAWDRTTGSADIVVAVLDTGVWKDHEDLQGQLLAGYDFVTRSDYANDDDGRDSDPSDPGDWVTSEENAAGTFKDCGVTSSSWHGTRVASIVAAAGNNGLGMAGVAYGSRVMPVRVLGKCGGFDSDIAAGMRWSAGVPLPGYPAPARPARVINLSLGGDGACGSTYRDAVTEVTARGAVVVVAAGNSAGRSPGAPANCAGVIAVTGLRHAGTKVGFSDLGPEISLGAPAGNCVNINGGPCLYPIQTASNSGTRAPEAGGSRYSDAYGYAVGTSFAAPIVAGAAALVLSVRPTLTPAEVRSVLQTTARPFPTSGADNGPDDSTPVTACRTPDGTDQLQCYCTTALCGAGMLDAGAALAAVLVTPVARVDVTTATPTAGSPVQLSAAASAASQGRSISAYLWEVVSAGGIVSGFSGATNAATASFTPSAAGTVTVRVTVTDNLGVTASADSTITVAAAPVPPTPQPQPSSGGGGGASSAAWVLGVLLAGVLLRPARRRAS
ncbi:MAG: S8 family serine peptidase [Rubrivivax sp.]